MTGSGILRQGFGVLSSGLRVIFAQSLNTTSVVVVVCGMTLLEVLCSGCCRTLLFFGE